MLCFFYLLLCLSITINFSFIAKITTGLLNQSITDLSLRNIIDKLAEFVARNGKEFENITKAKQQGNPRFGFLFGGEYNQYYQWRVKAEQTGNIYKLYVQLK